MDSTVGLLLWLVQVLSLTTLCVVLLCLAAGVVVLTPPTLRWVRDNWERDCG